MVYKELSHHTLTILSTMEKTILAVLLLLTVSAALTAADGSYQAAAKGLLSSSKSLKDKLICLERKLKVVNQCEKMLANVRGCDEKVQVAYKDCKDAYTKGERSNKVYTVNPDYGEPFKVYCNMNTDGGGWTVIQRRIGSTDFYRNWNDYVNGFGNLNSNHWLGLEKIHRLTKANSILRVDMTSYTKGSRYARYNVFKVGSSATSYKLTTGSYSGNAGDRLTYHNGMKFSTKDRDNDRNGGSCAGTYRGGWWYNNCYYSNLNGIYAGSRKSNPTYCVWSSFDGSFSLKSADMKVRRR